MTGPPEWPHSRTALIAWIITWIGDHGWNDCLRLVAVAVALAVVAAVLVIAAHLRIV